MRLLRLLFIAALACAGCAHAATDPALGEPFALRPRPALGPADARVVLVEFTDFACAHCRRFHERVWPKIKERYVDSGRIRHVALHLALEKGDAHAQPLAAAHAALAQGGYWAMREQLFSHAKALPKVIYDTLATRAGLDVRAFSAALRSPETAAAIAADRAEAAALGITTTPFFLVRVRGADGRWREARVDGYEDWPFFERTLEQALAP